FGRLKANDRHGVARVFDAVFEVMHDAARFAHAAGGDDNARVFPVVQLLTFLDGLHVAYATAAKQVRVVGEQFGRFLVEGLGVQPAALRGIRRQRAVHEDRNLGQPFVVHQSMQAKQYGLSSSQAERGDEDSAAAVQGAADDVGQDAVQLFDG